MWAIDQMRPLLFHHLLSSHPALLTPEGSSRLHFQVLRRFPGLGLRWQARHPLFPFRANISTLQDSRDVTGCEFASFSQGGTTLQHLRSPRGTGCLLRGGLIPTTDRTFTGKQTMTFRTHQRNVGPQGV